MERIYGSMKIKSDWFDIKKENRKILKLGYKGLNMYLTLGKYRMIRVTNNVEFKFHVTIDILRKDTGYSSKEVIELLKLLINQKIIKMKKPTRWDRLFDDNGKIKSDEMIIFTAIDVPKTDSIKEEGKVVDKIRTIDDLYISVDLDMLEHYKSTGLSEKYFPLYCLLRKLSNGVERKAYMTMEKMAETLGNHHDTINSYIKDLNRNYLLYSRKTSNGKKGYMMEHFIAGSVNQYDEFLRANKDSIERNIKEWENVDFLKGQRLSEAGEMELEVVEADLDETDDFEVAENDVMYEISENEQDLLYH